MPDVVEDKREVRYALRLPPELHRAVVELARSEDRSLNQQIIALLRQGVKRAEQRQRREQAR
jgi:predicted HicB family RNase H-like nuclease